MALYWCKWYLPGTCKSTHWRIHEGGGHRGHVPPQSHNVAASLGRPRYKIAFSFRGLRPLTPNQWLNHVSQTHETPIFMWNSVKFGHILRSVLNNCKIRTVTISESDPLQGESEVCLASKTSRLKLKWNKLALNNVRVKCNKTPRSCQISSWPSTLEPF